MMRAPFNPLVTVALLAALGLTACANRPTATVQAPQPAEPVASAEADGAEGSGDSAVARARPGQDIATRHATFKVSAFDSLPGWQKDNLGEAWAAFKESCKALERKPNWKPLCAKVKTIKDPKAGRQFLEREFALLTVQNTDRSRDGEITGYYEPLLQGRAQRDARFAVPVYGVPNDLYFLDWKTVPVAQRKGVTTVRLNGRLLTPAPAGPGTISIDLRRFTLDTLDRRLRVRIQGSEGLPYYTRADINRAAAIDAPVLAWVDDPIALYAMQVQGTGRIRMADGSILRLAYADQNGHPFKPMQLAAQGNERVQTRGTRDDAANDIEQFELAEAGADEGDPADAAATGSDEPLTRGARKAVPAADAGGVGAAVDALLPPAGTPARVTRPTAKPIQASPVPQTTQTPATQGGSQQMVDDLLTQAKGRQGSKAAPQPGAAPVPGLVLKAGAPAKAAAGTASAVAVARLQQRSQALDTDPSYVFFRTAPDQSAQAGPVGALGVPLTAGRSLAVDPRVLPLGYPVFLDAAAGDRRQAQMQRLMFAQDTGGAIRGAVRADYFWGFGADAGKQARRTKHRGRMWVLVPHAEVETLLSSRLLTRGARGATADAEQRECLIDDDTFCDATPADTDTPDASR